MAKRHLVPIVQRWAQLLPQGSHGVEKTPAEFNNPNVPNLLRLLTEATRATPRGGPAVYIPQVGADDAAANYNHFVFGQRGSGKSSLLRNLEQKKREDHQASVWIDQEVFTSLLYPDVLVSCVLDISTGLRTSLENAGHIRKSKLHRRLWRRATRSNHDILEARLDRMISNLRVLKFAPINSEIEWVHKEASAGEVEALGTINVGRIGAAGKAKNSRSKELTSTQTVIADKEQYLERSLTDFRNIVADVATKLGGGFVFVDDLYQISRDSQPRVLGYLHRLLKDSGVWLKVGSIRYATTTYLPKDPPVGMQESHDAHVVALDRQFNLYDTTKQFLEAILGQIAASVQIDSAQLFTDGARDRLMLASGGVARDYLRLTGESIKQAQNRGPSTKSGTNRVTVEDVNAAAGQIAPSKFDDLQKDSPSEADTLTERVIDLTEFCRDRRSAYFLVDSQDRILNEQMRALQHLRFAHLLAQSETIPDAKSQRFNVYLLDAAQLSAQRATQGVDFEGWKQREKRRNRKLVYSSNWESLSRPTTPPGQRTAIGTTSHNQTNPTSSARDVDGQGQLFS